jgi:hypothetical protein
MSMDDWFHENERQYDERMEEEAHFVRLDAVYRAKNDLLHRIEELYPGDNADEKIQRSKLRVEIMKNIAQDLEMEYGDTLPSEVIRAVNEEVWKLSKRKGWNE